MTSTESPPPASADYRRRIWERYASIGHELPDPTSTAAADVWGAPYDTYLRGWLPADRNAAIADVACGAGRLLRFFARRGYSNVTGVDVSEEQVAIARQLHPNAVLGDTVEFLNARPAAFDLITALDLVEHLTKNELLRFLDACHAALRPGGRLVIQTPNTETPWGLAVRYADFTHEIGLNPVSLAWLLRLCGFTDFQAREQGPVPHGLRSAVRFLLWKTLRLGLLAYNVIETGTTGSGVLTRVFIASAVKGSHGARSPNSPWRK